VGAGPEFLSISLLDGLAVRLSMSPGSQPTHVTPAGHGLEENGLLRTWYRWT
jgi:hypothetical protein